MRIWTKRHLTVTTLAALLALPGLGWAQETDPDADPDTDDPAAPDTEPPERRSAFTAHEGQPAVPQVQVDVPQRLSLGIDIPVVVPFGQWNDVSGIGAGALLRLGYNVWDTLQVTLRPGYIRHFSTSQRVGTGTENLSTSELLILVGARYAINMAWVSVETGVNSFNRMRSNGVDLSDSVTRVPLVFGGGYTMGRLQVGLNAFIPNFLFTEDGESAWWGLMSTVGYTIF